MKETRKKPGRTRKVDGESAVLEKIEAMSEPYKTMGHRLHELIKTSAPELSPRTWYGMPAYAREGKVVCFFRRGNNPPERYMTLGFDEAAHLDEGKMWAIAYALTELTPVEEKKIVALVKKAVS